MKILTRCLKEWAKVRRLEARGCRWPAPKHTDSQHFIRLYLPPPGPQTATIWPGWSVEAHNIAIFLIFGELKCQPSLGARDALPPLGLCPSFHRPAVISSTTGGYPSWAVSTGQVKKRKKADISCLVITAFAL